MSTLVVALALCLASQPTASALAAPPIARSASDDRAAVVRALTKLDAAQERASRLDTRLERSAAQLDGVIAEQERLRAGIETRAVVLYRTDESDYLSIMFGAGTIEDFTTLWDLLLRLSEQDARNLIALDAARLKAEQSARSLLALQVEAARAADAISDEVTKARTTLAAGTAAQREYEARVAAAAKAAARAAARKKAAAQKRTGTGAWLTGKASHYSKNFSGHGAAGTAITPYSMMVAHKTLPFHTLVEFEYNGKRCVASVEDRGPFTKGRMWDLGPGVVRVLGFNGVHQVKYRIIGR
ncbi:MAG: septal ring lytic transglycosylase RlpA family protein [Coriobacteriia bacterium]|nr:septal ring lytic transglycosylase RlpA family protein [Coriobacteriia bacterium]